MAYRINNKLTFIHIPKNAGTSISQWIEQNTEYQFDGQRHQHISALPLEWQDSMFCVVRNPYERAVSWYYFVQQMLSKKLRRDPKHIMPQLTRLQEGFESFVTLYSDFVFSKTKYRSASHIMTLKTIAQSNFISKDFKGIVLRYENIHHDWKIIQDMLGCNLPLPVKNITTYGVTQRWKKLYTDRAYDKISKLYEVDIKQFGYSFTD